MYSLKQIYKILFFFLFYFSCNFVHAETIASPSANNVISHCNSSAFPHYAEFQKAGARLLEALQTDFGRIKKSTGCYLEASPNNTQQVVELVKLAYANNIPIRTQGAAHSQNGSSLPLTGELLIHTTNLNQMTFNHVDRVTVGSGIPIALIRMIIERFTSYVVPVSNDGGPGPTIGGYISAGGISSSSEKYGGVWENIYEITLVAREGKIFTVRKRDPDFLYLFGSMGQFGIIAEVELNLLPNPYANNLYYPQGQTIRTRYPVSNGTYWTKPDTQPPLYWFNLFVPTGRFQEAKNDLLELQKKYPHALQYRTPYIWPIRHLTATPPLLFDKNEGFVAMGIWGTPLKQKESPQEFSQLQQDFETLTQQKNYKRYIQAELTGSPEFYEKYFPKNTFSKFKEIKTNLDPKFLFNKDSVFGPPKS